MLAPMAQGEKEKKMTEERKALLNQLQTEYNGCPYFDTRTKIQTDEITNVDVTIEGYYLLGDPVGDHYYAVIFEERPVDFVLSGNALTSLLDKYGDDAVGVTIRHLEKVKVGNGSKTYTPIRVIAIK